MTGGLPGASEVAYCSPGTHLGAKRTSKVLCALQGHARRGGERPRVGLGKIWCVDMYLNLTVKFAAISTIGAQIQKLN